MSSSLSHLLLLPRQSKFSRRICPNDFQATLSSPSSLRPLSLVVSLTPTRCSANFPNQVLPLGTSFSHVSAALPFSRTLHGRAFCTARPGGLAPNHSAYQSLLSACIGSCDRQSTQQLHSLVLKNGFLADKYFSTELIGSYSKFGNFDDALVVFEEIPRDNVACWNAVIAGAVRNGEISCALDIFRMMVDGACAPNGFSFSSILSACARARELRFGRGIHAWVVKSDAGGDVFVGTALVDLYAKCGDMEAAVRKFSRMPTRNVISWTALISGFAESKEPARAIQFFKQMSATDAEINKFTITSVLAACSRSLAGSLVFQVHCWVLKNGFYEDDVVKTAMISAYAKTGYMKMSEKFFEEADVRENADAWSVMISGLSWNPIGVNPVGLYQRMFNLGLRPDKFCTSSILTITDSECFGQLVHCHAVKSGLVLHVIVGCSLLTMYSRCNNLQHSYNMFNEMPDVDTASWSSMIAGFAEHGYMDEALRLFREMQVDQVDPDHVTISAILASCRGPQALKQGKEIHAWALRCGLSSGLVANGALVSMYSKCNSVLSARMIFDSAHEKDRVMWSSLISGYAGSSCSKEALSLFNTMVVSGINIDNFTCSSVIGLCATLFEQTFGRQLHALSIKTGLLQHLMVSSALVSMYSTCGNIDSSRKTFDEIVNPDLISWTAMIDGYAHNGRGMEALEVFGLMKDHGTKPDSVAMVGVLSACSHNGLLNEGFLHFNAMSRDYGVEPEMRHYACMVDLLSRSGRLNEAMDFISRMPLEPDLFIWSTILGACKVHEDVELARMAAEKVLALEPKNSGAHVSLSNISADTGDWEEVARIRSSIAGDGFKKEPGWSSV